MVVTSPGISFGPLPKQFYLQGIIVLLYFATWGKIVTLFLTTVVLAVWAGVDRIRCVIDKQTESPKVVQSEDHV